ncbi:hypothetical protein E4O86_16260 [Rhizobiales bacterium L72]|uniref:LVIVD repeat-containing protein n=2 Tax=Propylenella binzhouense TaxID=2555902 RepID=A0A964WUN7_9HYPH|nr:hypothetical protein [Propylenella binzhouense]
MKYITQDPLLGFGSVGEGMSLQACSDGRRILWLAHEGPPKNFTGVDVTDPRKPRVIIQTDLPHQNMRSNSLEVTGDIMAVAYQTYSMGERNAGIELFDVSKPESPRSISFFDCTGTHSRGVHCLWYVDGEFIHCASGAADFQPRHPRDDQFYRIIDVRNPAKPEEAGRWWLPGTREGDTEPPPKRLNPEPLGTPNGKDAFRAHNTNVYPDRPDRCYIGYIDGGAITLDISDKAHPKVVAIWNPNPPYPGFTHTSMPLVDRDLLIVSAESVQPDARDWPKLTFVLDNREETNPISISTLPLPPVEEYRHRGGRYGSHNLHENRPGPSYRSDTIVFGTFFNGGVRAYDTTDPFRPEEVAYFVPDASEGSRVPATQINDVYVDENGIVYAAERLTGGIHILELDI